ncbi:MFS general substrate transporter [Laetiporus sulphureus 93-53]|uniref:MFS general substrate transporter n=1 Tax=Laetiporus sulphureus 93-53 TaxID=1314785 RepID=A0A165B4X9_9APHY|nr:MFS general substrate transporter [Laetiporus sulphureus 93-53]KZT00246.1 MFS general substrate transporter [Laetiporus sulphureus 93-53]
MSRNPPPQTAFLELSPHPTVHLAFRAMSSFAMSRSLQELEKEAADVKVVPVNLKDAAPVLSKQAFEEDILFEEGSIDAVYQAKARVLSSAIREIGMGRYQWYLFIVAGFGWFSHNVDCSDSVWPLVASLILNPVVSEFDVESSWLSLALNIGLFVGAVIWALGCDIWGRRWPFNFTLLIAGVFGLAAGGSNDFVTLASLFAVVGFGVGGNMPVDSAVFLDFVPGTHQYLLTVLSIWWSVGQLITCLIAWPIISNFSCPEDSTTCTRTDNMGWRYLLFALGGLTLLLWAVRFFAFHLEESPRFLVGRGRDAEAVAVVHRIATYNGHTSSLTVEQLTSAGEKASKDAASAAPGRRVLSEGSSWSTHHIKNLFKTARLAWSTSLLIALWGIIGLASTLYNSFLPYLLAHRGAKFGDSSYYTTYREEVILGAIGVPSAFVAGWAVEQPYMGRKGTLAASAGLTGIFLFASTTARNSYALLGWNCGYAFASKIMYGVLYAISPEVFPAKDRGTGNGLTATATRIFGIIAPVIALYANLSTAVPVYVSGALIMGSGALALLLPYEPRGKASI